MVLNISKILLSLRWNVSNFPKMYISLKSNGLSLGVCSSLSLVLWKHRWYSWRTHLKPPRPWHCSVHKHLVIKHFSCSTIHHAPGWGGWQLWFCPPRVAEAGPILNWSRCLWCRPCMLWSSGSSPSSVDRNNKWSTATPVIGKYVAGYWLTLHYLLQWSRAHLYKEGRDLLGCVVVARYAVNHSDGINQTWDGVHHWNLHVNDNEPL